MRYGMQVDLNPAAMQVVYTCVDRDNDNNVIGSTTIDGNRVAESLRPSVYLYGLRALCNDRTSDGKVKELGIAKFDMFEKVVGRLEQGEWESERTVGAPTVSIKVEALARVKGISVGSAQKKLREYSVDAKEKIFANAKVLAAIKEIEAERESEEESLDDLVA
jgi:hypothetical protein